MYHKYTITDDLNMHVKSNEDTINNEKWINVKSNISIYVTALSLQSL